MNRIAAALPVLLAASLMCASTALANETPQAQQLKILQAENTQLRGRVDTLESQLGEIKALLIQQGEQIKQNRQTEAKQDKEEWLKIYKEVNADADSRSGKNVVTVGSGVEVQLYGYVKLDAAYDSSRADVGNFARWVESGQSICDDDQFNMTARQTRLGLKIKGPQVGSVKTSGVIEMDFYGGGTENKPEPRLRHAYMTLDWPEHRFNILAGQTWDVISPLYPDTVNFIISWWNGNIGWRRPQIRLTKEIRLCENVDMKLQGAVARTIGLDGDFDPGDTGEDSGFPSLQGRAAFTFPLGGHKPTTVGFSGHYAQEEWDTDAGGSHKDVESWSANLDVTQPVCKWLTFKGELFTGQNLHAYLGGIGQGVDTARIRGISSCGGWGAASLGPWDKWRFNIGAGVEAVDGSDVSAATARVLNRMMFGNVYYQINPNTSVGFEVSNWHTEYKHAKDGGNMRFQGALLYKF